MLKVVSPSLLLAGSFALLATSSVAPNASAQDERIYEAKIPPGTPFQPFTLYPHATHIRRIAYLAPQRQRTFEPRSEDERLSPRAEVQSRGSRPVVSGSHAVLKHGIAYAPANAPENVKAAIWSVNSISRKPYHWGGGHGSFSDSGYDCSGTVSFALHHAGVLNQPLASSDLLRYGERGRGRWITVYSRHGHTFAMIAGLRLDTTDFRIGGDVGPRWHTDGRGTGGFEARHPVGL